jgi:hypothetical protein
MATAQEEYSASTEAEVFFNSAMSQINSRHVAWIKNTAREMNARNLPSDSALSKARTYGFLGSMNGQDIEAIAFLVLMQAAKSAQEDLKAIMAHVKAINDQKASVRQVMNIMNDPKQSFTRIKLDSIKSISNQTQVIQKQNNHRNIQPVRMVALDSTKPVRANTAVTRAEIDATRDKLKNDLDSMSEMGEMESLRLQMGMDRLSKMMSTLSNILKKISDTANSIIQNLK